MFARVFFFSETLTPSAVAGSAVRSLGGNKHVCIVYLRGGRASGQLSSVLTRVHLGSEELMRRNYVPVADGETNKALRAAGFNLGHSRLRRPGVRTLTGHFIGHSGES